MQFLKIDSNTRLTDVTDVVGRRNVQAVLHTNGLDYAPNIGAQFIDICNSTVQETDEIDWQRKLSILNQLTTDSDVFEKAALSDSSDWKLLSTKGTFSKYLKIPEYVTLPNSTSVLGDGIHISDTVYTRAKEGLQRPPHTIDPAIFNTYSILASKELIQAPPPPDPFQAFRIPWGDVSLYSSISNESIDFPVYPEEMSDKRNANYTTMPDMLYQYEPWQIYTSSGPRTNTYTFMFHRDMWGNHMQGGANRLIRFCEANCYPEYNGSAVNVAKVTLLIKGKPVIRGVMIDVSTDWEGPLGHDGFYLVCKLSLTITEVSEQPLSYSTIRRKHIIG